MFVGSLAAISHRFLALDFNRGKLENGTSKGRHYFLVVDFGDRLWYQLMFLGPAVVGTSENVIVFVVGLFLDEDLLSGMGRLIIVWSLLVSLGTDRLRDVLECFILHRWRETVLIDLIDKVDL